MDIYILPLTILYPSGIYYIVLLPLPYFICHLYMLIKNLGAYVSSWEEKTTSIWMKITPVQCRANSDDSLEALLYNVNTN